MVQPKADPLVLKIGPQLQILLQVAHRARLPVLLIGGTGVGKSEVVEATARELGIGFVALDLSLCEPPDLVGLPRIDGERTCFVPPALLPRDGEGILLLEELNRAERFVLGPALQLLSARRLNDYRLPDGWTCVAAINPDDQDYDVERLDPALRARFLQVRVDADRVEWLRWARRSGVHAAILRIVDTTPDALAAAPPRSWTYASRVLHALTSDEARNLDLVFALLRGYLPEPLTLQVAAMARKVADHVLPIRELLCHLHEDQGLQRLLADVVGQGRTDVLHQIATDVCAILRTGELASLMLRGEFALESFELLLRSLPGDQRERCQHALGANRFAISLLGVEPRLLLNRSFRDSDLQRQLRAWAQEPLQRHRALLLVTGLCHHLGHEADLTMIRRSNRPLRVLGQLLADLPPELAGTLREVLQHHQIEWIPA